MHRNVVHHLLRRRQLCASPAYAQRFSQQTRRRTDEAVASESHSLFAEDQDTSPLDSIPPEVLQTLKDLDQHALVEAKCNLQAHIRALDHLKISLPPLFPTTLPVRLGDETHPYTIGEHRNRTAELPSQLDAAGKQTRHVIMHIADLQTQDYEEPGDELAAWREEIAGMAEEEKRERLKKMRFEEEAMRVRLLQDAKLNKERVEAFAAAARTREEERGEVVRGRRSGTRVRNMAKGDDGAAERAEEQKTDADKGTSRAKGKKGSEKEAEKEAPKTEVSLADLQKSLSMEYGVKK